MKYKDADDYVNRLGSPLQEVAAKLREIILSVSNDFVEEIKWNVPTYSINKNICSIMAHKNHVNLQIMQGAELKDSSLLEGTGKGMRHLKFRNVNDVNAGILKKLLTQAIKQDQK